MNGSRELRKMPSARSSMRLARVLKEGGFSTSVPVTGHLAGAAAQRGARAHGVDFADSMIALAQANYPNMEFQVADAQDLPFADSTFDLAAMAFGLSHLPAPEERGLKEALRILKPHGRFAYAIWLPPEEGYNLQAIVQGAVAEHGRLQGALPPSPPMSQFVKPMEAAASLNEIGFRDVVCDRHTITWRARSSDDVFDLIQKSTVRAAMLVEHQPPDARDKVKTGIRARAEALRLGDMIELGFPYLLVTARKS
jgi:SAM-dependent methyltransferase